MSRPARNVLIGSNGRPGVLTAHPNGATLVAQSNERGDLPPIAATQNKVLKRDAPATGSLGFFRF
jgi:hypothetical protein